jgi:hypothetical protein
MKWKLNHVPILLAASTLALAGLVYFQYRWIEHSRQLSDEIFHQQVSMALCSTIENCESSISCKPEQCVLVQRANGLVDSTIPTTPDFINNDQFHSELKRSLDFYNIDLPFQISQSGNAPADSVKSNVPMCTVNIPSDNDQAQSFVSLVFPSKNTYKVGKLKYMTGASIIILFFTGLVLLLANWWLLRQKRLMRRNTDMYNNMAHEFRTPLTNINLAAQLLSKKESDPGNQKFIDIIAKENSRLIQQVERVLHHARIDNGAYILKPERIPLRQLLNGVYHDMEIQIDEKKASVDFSGIPEETEIYGDRQHLTNVFRNLIDNALKYTQEKPEISITARDDKDGILISVQYNGIGIPASHTRLIFYKFPRLPQEQQTDPKGFGLGLSYVKRVIEMHKGFIQVDCALSKGSRFNVFLPKFS